MQQWWEIELMGNFMPSTYFPREEKTSEMMMAPIADTALKAPNFRSTYTQKRDDVCLCPKCLLVFSPIFSPCWWFYPPPRPNLQGKKTNETAGCLLLPPQKSSRGTWCVAEKKTNWAEHTCFRRCPIHAKWGLKWEDLSIPFFVAAEKLMKQLLLHFFHGTPEAHIKFVW